MLGLTFVFELFFLAAGLVDPLPLLKPIFSSDNTRCCSSSDKVCTSTQEESTLKKRKKRVLQQKDRASPKKPKLTLRNLFISISYSFFLWKKKKTTQHKHMRHSENKSLLLYIKFRRRCAHLFTAFLVTVLLALFQQLPPLAAHHHALRARYVLHV